MKLIDCLNMLPDTMKMIDLTATRKEERIKTIAEIKQIIHPSEDGYVVRTSKNNYGRDTVHSIGIIGGNNIFNELR